MCQLSNISRARHSYIGLGSLKAHQAFRMPTSYDFVVIGAGSGGSIAAATAARKGHSVLLVDQKRREKIGDKACGEAVGRHHFENLGVRLPTGEEVASHVSGIDLFSTDLKTVLRIKGEGLRGYTLNRLAFGQRLLDEAEDQGCEIMDRTAVTEPLTSEGRVIGVRCRKIGEDSTFEFHSKIVVDSSGVSAVTRKWLPSAHSVTEQVQDEDMELCYLEIRRTKELEDPEYLRIYLDQVISPGGYYWVFPKGSDIVNVGIGLQMSRGFPNPKVQFEKHILSQGLFKDSARIRGGGGVVPTRRPLYSLVGDGLLLVGDSGCMPNPIHGGGIGPSMIAGRLAGEVGSRAVETDAVRSEDMWEYNTKYMQVYGAKAAGLDVFRIFLQKCTNSDLNFGLANRLIEEEDILKASMGEELRLSITEKAQRAFRGIRRLSFLKALSEMVGEMNKIRGLYRAYPKPEGLADWVTKVDTVVSRMKAMEL